MWNHKMAPTRKTRHPKVLLTFVVFITISVVSCRPQVVNRKPTTVYPTAASVERTDVSSEEVPLGDEPKLDEPSVITFAVDESSRSTYERLAKAFHEQYPSISVQLVTPPGGFAAWNAADLRPLASAADTTLLFGSRNLFVNNAGIFLDLTSQMDSDQDFQPADFWQGALEACQDADGRTLGVPLTLSFMGIFYDPAAFDAIGLPHPKPGWTWDEFRQTVTTLAQQSAQGAEWVADSPAIESSVLAPIIDAQLMQSGGQIDVERLSDTTQWYIDLARSHHIYSIQPDGDATSLPGHPALWVGPLNASLPSGEDRPAIEKYQIAPFPTVAGQKNGTNVLWPSCAAISSGTKNPRAAWTWVNFLSRQWIYEGLSTTFLNAQVPARSSVADRIQYWDRIPANLHAAIRFGLENGWYGSAFPQAFQAVKDALFRALTGEEMAAALSTVVVAPIPTPNPNPIVVAAPQMQLPVHEGSQVIRYLYPTDLPNGDHIYKAFAEEFQTLHPDITVRVSSDFSWPGGDILPYLAKDYDCFYTGMESISQPELLYSLNDYVAREDPSFLKDFYPGRIDAFRTEDQIYGLPASNMLNLVYYNADLLAQKSLQPPALDWTFEDFLRSMNNLSSGTTLGSIYGTGGTEDLFFAYQDIHWIDLSVDPPRINFNQPSTLEAISWFDQFVKSGVVFPLTGDRIAALNQAISAGRVAYWTGLSRTGNTISFPLQYGVAPIPDLPSSTGSVGWLMGTGQFISRQSQNPEACWAWMKFLSQKPAAFPDVPARRSVVLSPDYIAMVGEETAKVYDAAQASTQKAELSLTLGPIRQWTWQALTTVSQGGDVNATMNETQRRSEVYLQCLDDAVLLHQEILSATPGNKTQREKLGECARKADPSYINPMLP